MPNSSAQTCLRETVALIEDLSSRLEERYLDLTSSMPVMAAETSGKGVSSNRGLTWRPELLSIKTESERFKL